MATFNLSTVSDNDIRSTDDSLQTASFFVSSPSPLIGLNSSVTSSAIENHSYIDLQKNVSNVNHHINSSSSYTFMEIKHEPCQVSEVTTSNGLQSNQQSSKTTSTTMTAMVKIESTSPKMREMEKLVSQINQNDSTPVEVGVARKRPFESSVHSTALQPARDMNYFGIRLADMGGVAPAAACGSIYFTGANLISGSSPEDINVGMSNVNRSTFWQYPTTLPIESVISMSPIGLPYSREVSRGQLLLLPAAASLDSFQQAAFLLPPYVHQNSGTTLQSPSNLIFPSMSLQTNSQSQSFTTPLPLFGSNYLMPAAAATSGLCQHSQANSSHFFSDPKITEPPQKHNLMKIEDCSIEQNRSNFISSNAKSGKSKLENEYNYLETHASSNLLEQTSMSRQELVNLPLNQTSFVRSPDTLQITPEVVGEMYKNPSFGFSSLPKTPEMQDVNIQTDTPACSDDESSFLNISTAEPMTFNIPSSEKKRSVSNSTPTQCLINYGTCSATLYKENVEESVQLHQAINDYSKDTTFTTLETCSFQSELISNKPINKNECFNSDSRIILPNIDRSENSSFKLTNSPVIEMTGLELLSNISTGSFVNQNSLKTLCVKKEPCDIAENELASTLLNNCDTYATSRSNLNIQFPHPINESIMSNIMQPSKQTNESLGGLNLLCALAEQRIQEEVVSNNIVNQQNVHTKKKHKHSKTKSNKKSQYYKKNKKKNAKERINYFKESGKKANYDDVHENIRNVLKKVDPNYRKLSKWSNPEDFFKAMETDMRMRLADITRQYKKKKKKLEAIKKIKKNKKSSSEYKFANISCKNPNFICFLDKFRSTSSNFPPSAKVSKNQHVKLRGENQSGSAQETDEHFEKETLAHGALISKSKPGKSLHNLNLVENMSCKTDRKSKRQKQTLEANKTVKESRSLPLECEQKTDGNPLTEIDKELMLSNDHLYRKETRVLTDMGGLFYAGILKPLQPPDVYAITLDGERGNKSHIMSREEIFKDSILEVAPTSIEKVPTGTRLCAYWSQQYRCLYPGKAIENDNTDISADFVSVEFDDGDSGRIRLQNIRFLLSDYPIVEYNENPFNTIGKNKKPSTIKPSSTDLVANETLREELVLPSVHASSVSDIDKIELELEKDLSPINLSEYIHKHKKHKKKKKHKKHHHKLSSKISVPIIDNDHKEENKSFRKEEGVDFLLDAETNNKLKEKSNCESEKLKEISLTKNNVSSLSKARTNSSTFELFDKNLPSFAVAAVSDKSKPIEKVDHRSGKGSKIAAFLPERQLWGWLGQAYRKAGLKGRARKQFYKTITRGKETITVGECAVFLSTGRPDRPYIGRIESMWETTTSNKVVRVRWFYHPEETTGCPKLKYPGALFDSPHEDENDVQTISHRCEVIEFSLYIAKFGPDARHYQSIYDNNDTYYLSGYYNPRLQVLKLQPDIPTEDNTSV